MNLVTNAAEAIEGSCAVTISTSDATSQTSTQKVILQVIDIGPGIGKDDLERIFEPFYSKKIMGRNGTELGLAVVWNSVIEKKNLIVDDDKQ